MKVNIAVIGCGIWGENIARNASELGVLACVCDSNRDRAISFSQKFSCPAFSFEQILNDNTLNGVIIATNANTHEKLACEALNAADIPTAELDYLVIERISRALGKALAALRV